MHHELISVKSNISSFSLSQECPPTPPKMPRVPPPGIILITAVLVFLTFMMWVSIQDRPEDRLSVAPAPMPKMPKWMQKGDRTQTTTTAVSIPTIMPPQIQTGSAVMAPLGNETLKAELGRAAWKLFHTTMARFPDKPSAEESEALKTYIHLFARLYPCGECATHFQKILEKYPPQTATRSAAAVWACHVHNQVNLSKGKEEFDCSKIGDFYDCGCADEEKEAMSRAGGDSEVVAKKGVVGSTTVEREGMTAGG